LALLDLLPSYGALADATLQCLRKWACLLI